MTSKQIMSLSDIEISKLSNKEIRQYVTTLNSVANKRINRLRHHKLSGVSSALSSRNYRSFRVSKSNNINQNRKDLYKVMNFLQDKTSTVKGAKNTKTLLTQTFNLPKNITNSQYKRFFKAFNKIRKNVPTLTEVYYREVSEEIIPDLSKKDIDIEEVIIKMEKRLHDKYEQNVIVQWGLPFE